MSEPLLSLRDLNAWYGEGHALHGVDLDVFPGETVTLLGRNGVGKTTTLRAVTILLVEQNFRFARRIADRFYVMEHGKITAGFPVAELDGRMALLHDVLGV